MTQIDKIKAEIRRRMIPTVRDRHYDQWEEGENNALGSILSFIESLEQESLDMRVQYASIEGAIKAHAETYSFNIESQLFPQLTKEQQSLWRKEIEYAVISGREMGLEVSNDERYRDFPKIKGWVARNQDGELWIHSSEPLRDCGTWQFSGGRFKLDNDLYPTLSWHDKPIEVELTLNRI